MDYEIRVGLTVDLPVVGNLTLPLTKSRELKLPTLSSKSLNSAAGRGGGGSRLQKIWGAVGARVQDGVRPARRLRRMGCRRSSKNQRFGVRRKKWWDPRIGK
jgi:hypothetical protein